MLEMFQSTVATAEFEDVLRFGNTRDEVADIVRGWSFRAWSAGPAFETVAASRVDAMDAISAARLR